MPALNVNSIENVKLGSTQLAAVYAGSVKIWPNNVIYSGPINLQYAEPKNFDVGGGDPKGMWYWAAWLPPNGGMNSVAGYSQNGTDAQGVPINTVGSKGTKDGQQIIETVDGVDYTLIFASYVLRTTTGYLIEIRGKPDDRVDFPNWSPWARIKTDGTSPAGEEPFTTDQLPQDLDNYNPDI